MARYLLLRVALVSGFTVLQCDIDAILLRNPLRPATAPAAASSSRVGGGGTTASKQRAIRGADRACVGLSSAPPHEPYSGTPNLMLRRTRYRTMARTRQNKLPLAGLRGGTRNSLLRH